MQPNCISTYICVRPIGSRIKLQALSLHIFIYVSMLELLDNPMCFDFYGYYERWHKVIPFINFRIFHVTFHLPFFVYRPAFILNINCGKLPAFSGFRKTIRNMQGFAFDLFVQGRVKRGATMTAVPGPPQNKWNHLISLRHFLL
jgi:hypothetical protein